MTPLSASGGTLAVSLKIETRIQNLMKKMKKLIVFIFILLPKFFYSQASSSGEFNITVSFERNIPVSKISAYSYVKSGNWIKTVNVKIDSLSNSITIKGTNHYIIPVNFPILYFSYSENIRINEDSNQQLERSKIFYLINEKLTTYDENYELKFTKDKPNILIKAENKNGVETENVETFDSWDGNYLFLKNLNITNEVLKLN